VGLPALLVPEAGDQAAGDRHAPRRHRLPRPGRGRGPVHREDDRLSRPQLRPAVPPVREGNALATGAVEIGDHEVALADIAAPTLVFAGATDGIAPVEAVRAVLPLLSGARDVRFEIVPGGHLGMLTGRAARGTTWQVLDEWIAQWSDAVEEPPAKKATAKKTTAKKTTAKKTTAKKTTAKKAPAKKTAASAEGIGSNPRRRYGSDGSRALSR